MRVFLGSAQSRAQTFPLAAQGAIVEGEQGDLGAGHSYPAMTKGTHKMNGPAVAEMDPSSAERQRARGTSITA